MKLTSIAALLVALTALSPAVADTSAPVKDWTVETVVVTAKTAGPALWHVAKNGSEVWILGMLGPVPEGMRWNSHDLEKVIYHANALLLPPRGQVGMFEGIWFLITSGDVLKLGNDQQLESVLPPPLKTRFVHARSAVHTDADHYADYKPSVAGFMLEGDFLKANGLSIRQPQQAVKEIAQREDVPVRIIADYPALQVVKEVPSLSLGGNLKCLSDSLDDIDVMSTHAKLAAQAWAIGDVDGIKAHYSEPHALDCLGQSQSFSKLWQKSVNDTVGAIDGALKHSGKTVVLINVGELLRKGGVLERLKAEGLAVEGPGD
jgi:uncharacterized protein YbaP (TraB family)